MQVHLDFKILVYLRLYLTYIYGLSMQQLFIIYTTYHLNIMKIFSTILVRLMFGTYVRGSYMKP